MITELSLEEQKQVLENGFNECMKNHLCGNYFNMSDIDGLEYSDIEWFANTDNMQLVAFTEFGTYHMDYDFDFSFDSNLQEFYSELVEFLYNNLSQ